MSRDGIIKFPKKFVAFIACFLLLSVAPPASAEVVYKDELTRPTGTNWGFPGYRVEYSVSDPEIAEVIKGRDGQYRVRLIKPGDVVVSVVFFSGGERLAPELYLFHITGKPVDDTAFDWSTFALDIIRLTNAEREKAGLKPLAPAFDLSDAAITRAEEASRVFSHTRPDGEPYYTVFEEKSYEAAGENLQAGASTPEDVITEWMNSPSHRENILSDEFTELGVGYYYDPNSQYHHYWVQLFRR